MRSSYLFLLLAILILTPLFSLPICHAADAGEVTLYSSVDDPYVRPLIARFEKQTGIHVTLVTDGEATKTAGLVEKIEAEKAHPKADVYWGNEPFHTINLAEKNVFAPYRSPIAKDIPTRWLGKGDLWASIGLRARILAYSSRPEYKAAVAQLKSIHDLERPEYRDKIGICHPGFGTASGHFAALYVLWGQSKYEQFLHRLHDNHVKLLGGNSVVAEQIIAGTLLVGPTDTDDVNNGKAEGEKIDGVIPDQDSFGTLLLPTTIALVKGASHPANGQKLIDFLLAPEIEKGLIDDRYLAYSVRHADKQVKAMDVDYVEVAHQMRKAIEIALNILQNRAPAR